MNSFCTGHKFTSREQFPPCLSRAKSNEKLKGSTESACRQRSPPSWALGAQLRETNRSNNDHEKAELFSVLLLRLLGPKDWGWRDYHQAGVRREDKARGAIIPQSKPGVQNAVNLDLTVLRERERECVCVCVCVYERESEYSVLNCILTTGLGIPAPRCRQIRGRSDTMTTEPSINNKSPYQVPPHICHISVF